MKLRLLSYAVALALLVSCSGPVEENEAGQPNTPPAPDFTTSEYLPEYDCPDYAPARAGAAFGFSLYNGHAFFTGIKDTENIYKYYTELGSGVNYAFCAKPECTHDSKDCQAYSTNSTISYYDGNFYYLSPVPSRSPAYPGQEETVIIKRPADGSAQTVAKYVHDDEVYSSHNGSFESRFIHRGFYYRIGSQNIVVDSVPKKQFYILSCPISFEKDFQVLYEEEYTGSETLYVRAVGSSIYILTYRSEQGTYDTLLRRFDTAANTLETLYSSSERSNIYDLHVESDGTIYISAGINGEGCGIYRLKDRALEKLYGNPKTPPAGIFICNGVTVSITNYNPETYSWNTIIRDFEGKVLYEGELSGRFTREYREKYQNAGTRVSAAMFITSYFFGDKDAVNMVISCSVGTGRGTAVVKYDISETGLTESLLFYFDRR